MGYGQAVILSKLLAREGTDDLVLTVFEKGNAYGHFLLIMIIIMIGVISVAQYLHRQGWAHPALQKQSNLQMDLQGQK